MHPQYAALATFAVAVLATVAKPLAPPATGWMYDDGPFGSFVFPLTATQCEPFYIFYNSRDGDFFLFKDATNSTLFRIDVPAGVGYVEWICNIPANIAFYGDYGALIYVVQPGSSSACLGDLTTTYSILSYSTAAFASFTRTASPLTTPLSTITLSTASYLTGAFSTITLNPTLVVSSTTSSPVTPSTTSTSSPLPSPTVSSPSSSSPSFSPPVLSSSKSRTALVGGVVGGVVGGAALFLLLVLGLLWRRRQRQRRRSTTQPPADILQKMES